MSSAGIVYRSPPRVLSARPLISPLLPLSVTRNHSTPQLSILTPTPHPSPSFVSPSPSFSHPPIFIGCTSSHPPPAPPPPPPTSHSLHFWALFPLLPTFPTAVSLLHSCPSFQQCASFVTLQPILATPTTRLHVWQLFPARLHTIADELSHGSMPAQQLAAPMRRRLLATGC